MSRILRIPGDRYFIAGTSTDIEVWDLGVPYAKGSKPCPNLVAEVSEEAGSWIQDLFDLFPHGSDSVRFGVRTCNRESHQDL
jgi:hypothetical protein